jgi:hypothetical protein
VSRASVAALFADRKLYLAIKTNVSRQRQTPFISLRIKLVIGFTLAFTIVFALAFYWFYQFATQRALEQIQVQMVDTLQGAIAGVDGDAFVTLARATTIDPNGSTLEDILYREHQAWIQTIHTVEPRSIPYTFVKGEEAYEVRWVGDIFRIIRPESQTEFLDPYIADPENTRLYEGFEQLTTSMQPYEDKWGHWVSAYGPIRASDGSVVGGFGIDYRADYVSEVQQAIKDRILLAFLLTYAGLFALVWFVSSTFTRSITNLQRAAASIGEGRYDQDFTGLIDFRFPDEIVTLAEVFEFMVRKVQAREEHLKQQVAELSIVIDEAKRQQQVSEIVETDFFQDLTAKAIRLRRRSITNDDEPDTDVVPAPDLLPETLLVIQEAQQTLTPSEEEESRHVDRYQILDQELESIPHVDGVIPTDILALPGPFDVLLRNLMRKGSMTVEQLASELDLTVEQAHSLGEHFVAKGYLRAENEEEGGEQVYRVYFARMRRHDIPNELVE